MNRMEAVRLIAGHMNATVPACRISCRKYGGSSGAVWRTMKRAPIRLPKQFGDDEDDDAHIGCFL